MQMANAICSKRGGNIKHRKVICIHTLPPKERAVAASLLLLPQQHSLLLHRVRQCHINASGAFPMCSSHTLCIRLESRLSPTG